MSGREPLLPASLRADAFRQHRTAVGVAWGVTAALCTAASAAAIVLGVAAMASK